MIRIHFPFCVSRFHLLRFCVFPFPDLRASAAVTIRNRDDPQEPFPVLRFTAATAKTDIGAVILKPQS
jgi:hypothetical protein